MKLLLSTTALLILATTIALAQSNSAAVTGAVDANKNRTTATEAKEDTKAGNKQAISPANAGNEAAQKQSSTQPKQPNDLEARTNRRRPSSGHPDHSKTTLRSGLEQLSYPCPCSRSCESRSRSNSRRAIFLVSVARSAMARPRGSYARTCHRARRCRLSNS